MTILVLWLCITIFFFCFCWYEQEIVTDNSNSTVFPNSLNRGFSWNIVVKYQNELHTCQSGIVIEITPERSNNSYLVVLGRWNIVIWPINCSAKPLDRFLSKSVLGRSSWRPLNIYSIWSTLDKIATDI